MSRPDPDLLDNLLAYFDEYEPAVADAIRYGLKVADTKRRGNQTPAEWEREPGGYQYRLTYSVDYPPGHPKA